MTFTTFVGKMKKLSFCKSPLFCVFLLCCWSIFHGQNAPSAVDSLLAETISGHDTLKVQAYTELCRLLHTTNTERAIEFGVQPSILAATISDSNGEAVARQTLANAYIISGNYGEAG